MGKKSLVTKRKWPVPEYKRQGRSRQFHVQKQKPKVVSLRIRKDVKDFEASESGFTEFLQSLLNMRGVFYEKVGRNKGKITFPRSSLNKVKEYYEKIRMTAYPTSKSDFASGRRNRLANSAP